jgi:hypothetical protein
VSFDAADPIAKVFANIIGKPAWLVRRGYASYLTFEFGEPHLEFREPIPDSKIGLLRRRNISVRGDWHLWIRSCDWRVTVDGGEVARSESADHLIDAAARALDSRQLLAVDVDRTGSCRFTLELGALLETTPYDDDRQTDQWLLFAPDGNVLTLRGDAKYCWGPGSLKPDQEMWIPL